MSIELIRDLTDDYMTKLCSKYCLDKGCGNYPDKTFGGVPRIVRPHGYSRFYNKYFKDERSNFKSILEIGVQYGNSLLLWDEYFPNSKVYGFDIDTSQIIKEAKHFNVVEGDHFNLKDLDKLFEKTEKYFDLIVEDGGHEVDSQQIILGNIFKNVKPGGYYIIEDIHTSLCDKNRYNINEDRTNSTLFMLQNFQKTGKIESEFISQEQKDYLKENIEMCVVSFTDAPDFRDPMRRNPGSPSITSILRKRHAL